MFGVGVAAILCGGCSNYSQVSSRGRTLGWSKRCAAEFGSLQPAATAICVCQLPDGGLRNPLVSSTYVSNSWHCFLFASFLLLFSPLFKPIKPPITRTVLLGLDECRGAFNHVFCPPPANRFRTSRPRHRSSVCRLPRTLCLADRDVAALRRSLMPNWQSRIWAGDILATAVVEEGPIASPTFPLSPPPLCWCPVFSLNSIKSQRRRL